MVDARVSDPAVTFRFEVLSPKLITGIGFSKVTGLRDESEVIEYREGRDENLGKRKFAGMREYPAMVFSRGMTREATSLLMWRKAVLSGTNYRAPITVSVKDSMGKPQRYFKVDNAWPSALEMADLDAMSSEVAIETMEVQHEGRTTSSGSLFIS